MAQSFDVGEIFEMAVQMEKNGAAFYKKVSESVSDKNMKKTLIELQVMEINHEKIFETLKKKLEAVSDDYFDPSGEAVKYLRSIADTKMFFKRKIDVSSMEKILKGAISVEKDSVIFYLGMKELVPDDIGKGKIEKIIKEEMTHVRILNEKLSAIKK